MKVSQIKRNIIRCKLCGEVIGSKTTHDFVTCKCGKCSVDGGLSYLRRCGDMENWEDPSTFEEIEVTPKYKAGDKVRFFYLSKEKDGQIVAVDCYSANPHYKIFVAEEDRTYSYIAERDILWPI